MCVFFCLRGGRSKSGIKKEEKEFIFFITSSFFLLSPLAAKSTHRHTHRHTELESWYHAKPLPHPFRTPPPFPPPFLFLILSVCRPPLSLPACFLCLTRISLSATGSRCVYLFLITTATTTALVFFFPSFSLLHLLMFGAPPPPPPFPNGQNTLFPSQLLSIPLYSLHPHPSQLPTSLLYSPSVPLSVVVFPPTTPFSLFYIFSIFIFFCVVVVVVVVYGLFFRRSFRWLGLFS